MRNEEYTANKKRTAQERAAYTIYSRGRRMYGRSVERVCWEAVANSEDEKEVSHEITKLRLSLSVERERVALRLHGSGTLLHRRHCVLSRPLNLEVRN
ncbi:hypothetical protein J6590_009265 [Homalodisca vitripennis]|nr:hypothetical protein J6590_009265 [Homalodisca vitripennis]